MKARKIILDINLQALSSDCFCSMLYQLIEQIKEEQMSGRLVASDGDTIEWFTKVIPVEF